jgi:nuclear pore complex protein Nup107
MDLATIIAAEGSDLADLFLKTGRMEELVAALAGDSTSLLYSTGPDKSQNKPSKKIREKGWTRDLWRIQI